MIYSCIENPRISILVNGSPQDFFETTMVIRQGDSLFPFLYIILEEFLGRSIKKVGCNGSWKGIKVARGIDLVTHVQFVDDTYLKT